MLIPIAKRIWQWRGVWITTPIVAGLLIGLRSLGWIQPLEWMAYDHYMRQRPREPRDARIIIIGVTEQDLQQLDRYPVSDATLARLLQKVKQQQPRAIGLDFFRDFPVAPGTPQLNQVFQTTPNLIGIEKLSGSQDRATIRPSAILKQHQQTAINNIVTDADGKLRRNLLFWTTPDGSNTMEYMGLRLALMYLEPMGITPMAATENENYLQLGQAVMPIFESNDGSYVNADAGGYQTFLNYRGPSGSFTTVAMLDVLNDRVDASLMRDRIVLIGPTAESVKDFFYTPFSGNTITTPEKMAGVEVIAHVTSQILSSALEGRSGIRVWSDQQEWAWIGFWSLVGSLVGWCIRNPRWALASMVTLEGSLLIGTYWLFLQGWWIPVVPPAIATILAVIALTGYVAALERNDRKLVMNLFGRYVTPKIAEAIWSDREQLLANGRVKGQKMSASVLFTDIKDFSTISERTDPEELMEWLNEYMDAMTKVVFEHGAVVDKFIGDAVMAVFGVPIARTTPKEVSEDAVSAVRCAIGMGKALEELNGQWAQQGKPEIKMRVGISTGTVVTGSLGGKQRMDYTAIGDTVNIAARLESFDKSIDGGICRILISDATYTLLKDGFPAKAIGSVQLKGREQPTEVYQILSLMPESPVLQRRHEDAGSG
ncbi:MAG: adenylate/guanylate cyclase domain-containing protein [Synechococcales bacterium]|nr:adenylate/guanylate cyclase domain-containing protein [Synechococcales bacterium]